ncbi:hypothetical protein ACH4SP_10625 [Streptomyces sp. NPDC021093]|uniref:hypothetical protein n=1 Tax=Streptomyces sp. NPDC021093 TaxID=3365112 RepID=UPI003789CC31
MSGLTSRLPRWRGRRSATTSTPDPGPGSAAERAPHTVLEEFGRSGPDGTRGALGTHGTPVAHGAHSAHEAAGFLLRSSADRRTSVQELARSLPVERERPVVIVDVAADAAGNLGEELGGLLGRLRDERRTAARLVMSGAAARKSDGQPPLAQRLADAWELELEAPDAAAVLVPGGGLYVTEPASPAGGWWRFAPGAEPEALGARIPAPNWQRALARVPLGELGGCTVRQIPAGLLLHPSGTAAPRPGDLAFALTVHPDRLTVLVSGAPAGQDLAEDLAALLARLPGELRGRVRLAPGDGHDLLPVAQHVADLLGTEVEVCTGLPLPHPLPAAAAPGTAGHPESVRLHSPEGECTWPALLTAVVCAPTEPGEPRPAPRPVHWLLPDAVGTAGPEPAALRLPDGQYVVAVRAGLWVGGSATAPAPVRDRPAEARAVRIEVEDTADDDRARGALLKALAALLPELDGQVREHAEITAPAGAGPETVTALRRFGVRNGLTFATTPGPSEAGAAVPARTEHAAPAPAPAPDTPWSPVTPVTPVTPVRPDSLASASSAATSTATSTTASTATSSVTAMVTAVRNSAAAAVATTPAVSAPAPRPSTSSSPASSPTSNGPTGARQGNAAAEHTAALQVGSPAPVGEPVSPATTAEPLTRSGESPAERSAHTEPSEAPATVPSEQTPPGESPAPKVTTPPVRVSVASARRLAVAPVGFSSDADREAFRELAAAVWEEHTGPVNQALIRLPALRGPGEAAARADLIAVHLYLSSPPDSRFGARALAAQAEAGSGSGDLGPYAACLSSGLRRLPALRGTLMRAVPGPEIPEDIVPGAYLYCAAPLDVVHLEQKGAPLPPEEYVRYVVRPVTARRTSVLARPGSSGAAALFAAGTEFSVLDVHRATDDLPARVLLAEVPSGSAQFRAPSDEAVARLDAAACRSADPAGAQWPERCSGPFPTP